MNTWINERRAGKSEANRRMLRAALKAGKTVCVITPGGITKQKMHKSGLVLITPLRGRTIS